MKWLLIVTMWSQTPPWVLTTGQLSYDDCSRRAAEHISAGGVREAICVTMDQRGDYQVMRFAVPPPPKRGSENG